VTIAVEGLPGAHLLAPALVVDGVITVDANPDAVTNVRMHVVAPADVGAGSHNIRFTIRDSASGDTADSASAFLAGGAP
jgi:hypothetical protein